MIVSHDHFPKSKIPWERVPTHHNHYDNSCYAYKQPVRNKHANQLQVVYSVEEQVLLSANMMWLIVLLYACGFCRSCELCLVAMGILSSTQSLTAIPVTMILTTKLILHLLTLSGEICSSVAVVSAVNDVANKECNKSNT